MTTAKPTKAAAKPAAKPARPAAKPAKLAAKPAKPAAKRTRTTKRKPVTPSYGEIAERAYFIHLEGGGEDQVANWFRAERELTAA